MRQIIPMRKDMSLHVDSCWLFSILICQRPGSSGDTFYSIYVTSCCFILGGILWSSLICLKIKVFNYSYHFMNFLFKIMRNWLPIRAFRKKVWLSLRNCFYLSSFKALNIHEIFCVHFFKLWHYVFFFNLGSLKFHFHCFMNEETVRSEEDPAICFCIL